MKPQDLRDQTKEDLILKHKELSDDLFKLVNELQLSKKVDKPHLIKKNRRDIARVKTILREKY